VATDESSFSIQVRGYNRDEVDKAMQELRRELIKANTEKAEASKDLKQLHAQVAELQTDLEEVGAPTYSGLGARLETTLRLAEEQSTRLIGQADIDAEKLRAAVQKEAVAAREEAREYAERLVREANEQAAKAL